jgi:hypothetical protein
VISEGAPGGEIDGGDADGAIEGAVEVGEGRESFGFEKVLDGGLSSGGGESSRAQRNAFGIII